MIIETGIAGIIGRFTVLCMQFGVLRFQPRQIAEAAADTPRPAAR
ncbi:MULTISPECIES: hypothetical protein [unclassified Neisseria]|nr:MULTISPECIES: hypothetical protein [unclassified Neisseria]